MQYEAQGGREAEELGEEEGPEEEGVGEEQGLVDEAAEEEELQALSMTNQT